MKMSASHPGAVCGDSSVQRIIWLRLLLGVSLLAGAAITGFLSFYLLSGNESEFAASQFKSIATQALSQMTNRFVCHDAEDGQRGVDAFLRLRAEGVQLDAILMDFEMPVMNGPTATKVLRDLGCGCFIAGVTGNVLPADIDHFKAQGADTVLAKPLNLDLFEAAWGQYRFSAVGGDEQDAYEPSGERNENLHIKGDVTIHNDGTRCDSGCDNADLETMESGGRLGKTAVGQDTEGRI